MVPSSGCCIFQSKVSLVQFLHKMNLLCLARMRERDSQCSSFSYKLSIEKKKLFNSSLFALPILLQFLNLPGLLGFSLIGITHCMNLFFFLLFTFSDLLFSLFFHLVNFYPHFLSSVISFSALFILMNLES